MSLEPEITGINLTNVVKVWRMWKYCENLQAKDNYIIAEVAPNLFI
jgi:hypothetical protein